MATEDCLIGLFCGVDDRLGRRRKHPQARLWPSERLTIGLWFALNGCSCRSVYRWLARDAADRFGGRPERTRWLRAVRTHQGDAQALLADPTCFTGIDPSGIDLLHPCRSGRSPRHVGKPGFSTPRWIVGLKLRWLINAHGQVVAWDWTTAKTADPRFAQVAAPFQTATLTLADSGFIAVDRPATLKRWARGAWHERRLVEPVLSRVHRVCHLTYLGHRPLPYLALHLAYVAAVFTARLPLNRLVEPPSSHAVPWPQIAQYAL